MPLRFAQPTREAHRSPLLVGRLLDAALVHSPGQEIVQDGGRTFTYRQLRERIGRLASALAGLGVQAGETVAMLDWDQDVATMRADGSVQVRDRLKDVIKSGGEWICSLTLEEIAARHPDVVEIAVIGRPDDM